jgi:signal transduction histidine kinase
MKRPLLIFYVLVIYVFLSFIWWTYLMFDYNHLVYELRKQVTKQQIQQPATQQHQQQKLYKEYNSKKWMIIGEGSVFFLLLLAGTYMIHRGFRKERWFNRQQQNFLLAITHELKSPLSSIKLGLQTLQNQKLKKQEKEEVLDSTSQEMERLQNLVDNVLFAARFEQETGTPDFKVHNFSHITEKVVEQVKQATNKPVQFKTDIAPDLKVEGEGTGLTVLVQNLLSNAVKYSPPGKTVQVNLAEKRKSIQFKVKDQGPGIPEKEWTNIFKRFYRVGDEDTRNTKGTGLGLYIVDQVVKRHSGTVEVQNQPAQGTEFTITLPKATG